MAIYRWVRTLFRQKPVIANERVLDHCIRSTLVEDALRYAPVNTWDRLRMVILERALAPRRYGMWVLDEPLRDPPEFTTVRLNETQHSLERRFHNNSHYPISTLWGGIFPLFPSAIMNF